MAHLRDHSNSKFWYVRFRDLDSGIWREESTRLLKSDPQQTRAAQRIADKKTREENQLAPQIRGAFREWVWGYIRDHYTRESTRERATFMWERLAEWLNSQALRHPRELRYEHARQYLNWRTKQASHNTALGELKFMAFILQEAIRREFLERNVFAKLGIGREPAKIKPELSDEQLQTARQAVASIDWMRIAAETQIFTGCRVSETSLPLTDVLFTRNEVVITDSKRKANSPKKRYAVPMDPMLREILWPLRDQERTIPFITKAMEARYNEVLRKAISATSHSFRVTYISRLRDAGIEERDAMALVNHSSREVHAIYARTDTNRLRPIRSRLVLPPPLVRDAR